jgi:hypothetical protein
LAIRINNLGTNGGNYRSFEAAAKLPDRLGAPRMPLPAPLRIKHICVRIDMMFLHN